MKKVNLVLMVLALLFSAAYSANAETLYTSPLFSAPNDFFRCGVVNISAASISVTVEKYTHGGTLLSSNTINLGAKRAAQYNSIITAGTQYYCKFITADKSKVRANAVTWGTDQRIFATSEAR